MSRLPTALVTGLTRDSARYIKKHIFDLSGTLKKFFDVEWFVVESDSSDATVLQLEELAESMPGFSYKSLGDLSLEIPNRTERLAACRNVCLDVLEASSRQFEYLIVIDLDLLVTAPDFTFLNQVLEKKDWSGIFANTQGPYYDLLALRHPLWNHRDPFEFQTFLLSLGLSKRSADRAAITSKMIKIPTTASLIEVRSAFGGFGVYRTSQLSNARYLNVDSSNLECSEHVAFNEAIVNAGGRLFIVPSMIVAKKTEHTNSITPLREAVRSYLIRLFN